MTGLSFHNVRINEPFHFIYTFACLVVFLSTVAYVSNATATTTTTLIRPTTLKFVLPIEISISFEAGSLYVGAAAAFRQHNNQMTTPNVDAKLIVEPMFHSVFGYLPDPILPAFYYNGDTEYFGILGTRLLSDSTFSYVAESLGIPTLCPQPVASPRGLVTQIAMRAAASMETAQTVNFAMHNTKTMCSKAAIFGSETGPDQVEEYLLQAGAPVPIKVNRSSLGTFDTTAMILALTDPDVTCIFINDVQEVATPVIQAAQMFIPGRFADVYWFMGSGATKAEYTAGVDTFQNVFGAQVTPDPQHPTLDLAREFREAMADPQVKVETDAAFGAMLGVVSKSDTPNFASFEGYIAARMALEALSNTANVTRANFLDSVYRSRMMLLSGYSAGPFTRGCSLGAAFPCDCNVGLKRIYMSRVNYMTGQHEIQSDNTSTGEVDVAALVIPMEVCEEMTLTVRRSLRIVLVYPTSSAAATKLGHPAADFGLPQQLISTLYSIINATNVKSVANSVPLAIQLVPVPYDGSDDIESTFLPRLKSRYHPYVYMGAPHRTLSASTAESYPYATTSNGFSLPVVNEIARLLPNILGASDADDSFRSTDIDLFGSLADHIHSLVAFVTTPTSTITSRTSSTAGGVTTKKVDITANVASRPVYIIGTTGTLVSYAVRSLNTYQASPASQTVANTAAKMTAAILSLIPSSTGTYPFAILVASNDRASTAAVVALAPSLPKGVLILLAADEASITNNYVADPPTNVGAEVLFSTVFGVWWTASVFSAVKAANPNQRVPGSLLRPQALVDLMVGIAGRTTNASQPFVDTLYSASVYTLDNFGITLGQFSNAACSGNATAAAIALVDSNGTVLPADRSPSRRCDCAKGSRRIFVHSLRDWSGSVAAAASSTQQYALELGGCGITYLPLLTSDSSLSTTAIALIIAGAALFVVLAVVFIVMFAVFLRGNGRNHNHAPKDSELPFAIVFTDIQSSTVLWAHASAAMSAAVDSHNTIMRSCISRTRGYEVKTVGDSFMVAFKSASDAVKFAVDAQRAFFDAEWSPEIDNSYIELERVTLENQRSVFGGHGGEQTEEDMRTVNSFTPRGEDAIASGNLKLAGSMADDTPRSFNQAKIPLGARSMTDSGVFHHAAGSTAPVHSHANQASNANHSNTQDKDWEIDFTKATDKHAWNGIRVRMGIHFGFGECKRDPVTLSYDYYGTIVNTAARVESIGHGGMVLVTRDVVQALADDDNGAAPSRRQSEDQPTPLTSGQSMDSPKPTKANPVHVTSSHPSDETAGNVLATKHYNAKINSMGFKQLRGLPNDIEIVEIVLKEFSFRRYPQLRLDRDGALETAEDATATDAASDDSYVLSSISTASDKGGKGGKSKNNSDGKSEIGSMIISIKPPSNMAADPSQTGGPATGATATITGVPNLADPITSAADKHANAMAKISNHPPLTGQYAATNEIERYAEKNARLAKIVSLEDFMSQFRMVRAVFAQVAAGQLRDLLELISKKWHVALPKLVKLKRAKATAERIDNYIMTHLVVKLARTLAVGYNKTAKGGGLPYMNPIHANLLRKGSNTSRYSAVEMLVNHAMFQQNASGNRNSATVTTHVPGNNTNNQTHTVQNNYFLGGGGATNSIAAPMPSHNPALYGLNSPTMHAMSSASNASGRALSIFQQPSSQTGGQYKNQNRSPKSLDDGPSLVADVMIGTVPMRSDESPTQMAAGVGIRRATGTQNN